MSQDERKGNSTFTATDQAMRRTTHHEPSTKLRMPLLLAALATLSQVFQVACVSSHVCGTRSVTLHGRSAETIRPEECEGGETVTLVSVRDYVTGGDDDFGFAIFESPVTPELTYVVNGLSAGPHSVANVRFHSLQLPDYVRIARRSIHHLSEAEPSIPPYVIPSGFEAIALIELLGYEPAGDDDFEYVVQPLRTGSSIDFITRLDRGNGRSRVTFRVTVLEWPDTRAVRFADDLFALTRNGMSNLVVLPEWQRFFLITPTAYTTRGDDDVWYAAQVEHGFDRTAVRLTVDGGGDDADVMIRVWAVAFE